MIEEGWERINVSADSAAVDTVAPPQVGKNIPLRENDISKNGISFEQPMELQLPCMAKRIQTESTVNGAP